MAKIKLLRNKNARYSLTDTKLQAGCFFSNSPEAAPKTEECLARHNNNLTTTPINESNRIHTSPQ